MAQFKNPMDQITINHPTFSAAGLLGMILTAPDVSISRLHSEFRLHGLLMAAGPLGSHQEVAFAASFLRGVGIGQLGVGK